MIVVVVVVGGDVDVLLQTAAFSQTLLTLSFRSLVLSVLIDFSRKLGDGGFPRTTSL